MKNLFLYSLLTLLFFSCAPKKNEERQWVHQLDARMQEFRKLNPDFLESDKIEKRTECTMLTLDGIINDQNRHLYSAVLGLDEHDIKLCQIVSKISFNVHSALKFYPKVNQLMAVFLFLHPDKNSLAQISTGQGKTVIAAMTAIARQKLYDETVFVVTTTEALAHSGVNEMTPLYQSMNVNAAYYNFQGFAKNFLSREEEANVIYATSSSILGDKLGFEDSYGEKSDFEIWRIGHQKKFSFVVDECDAILYDNGGAGLKRASKIPFSDDIMKMASSIAKKTLNFYSRNDAPTKEQVDDQIKFLKQEELTALTRRNRDSFLYDYAKSEIEEWLTNAFTSLDPHNPNWQEGVSYKRQDSLTRSFEKMLSQIPKQCNLGKKIKEGKKLHIELSKKANTLDRHSLAKVRESAIKFKHFMQRLKEVTPNECINFVEPLYNQIPFIDPEDETLSDYQIAKALFKDRILYIEKGTAQIIPNMTYGGLIHPFLEYKEYSKTMTVPTMSILSIGQLSMLKRGDVLIGFTGTLPNKIFYPKDFQHFSEIMRKAYAQKGDIPQMVIVPDFVKSQKIEEPRLSLATKEEWQEAIIQEIHLKRGHQAILVVVRNPKEAQAMKELLAQAGYDNVKTYQQKEDREIASATYSSGDIIISTTLGSRGTDWRVEAPKGLHVLCSYIPENRRTAVQISGRAGRKGRPGSYREIIFLGDDENNIDEFRQISENFRQSALRDIYTKIYLSFRKEIGRNDEKKSQLILWMSMSATRKTINNAIEQFMAGRLSPYEGIDKIVETYLKKFFVKVDKREAQKLIQKTRDLIERWYADIKDLI